MPHIHEHTSPDGHQHDTVMRRARLYDLAGFLILAGRGPALRQMMATAVGLQPGQRVLDVASGTGTLALSLAGRVGPGGSVVGVDASPEMVARASQKAGSRRNVTFEVAHAQALPFPDDTFHALTCTLAMHHIKPADRALAVQEFHRVLRPGGHLLIADFQPPQHGLAKYASTYLLGHQMTGSDLQPLLTLCVNGGFVGLHLVSTIVPWLGVITGTTCSGKPQTARIDK